MPESIAPENILAPDEVSAETEKGNILVVDDEADIRESLETLLGLEGYSVDSAQNAAEGMSRLEARPYDVVLLDLMMPDRSGMDVLKEIREKDTDTPVVMITAY